DGRVRGRSRNMGGGTVGRGRAARMFRQTRRSTALGSVNSKPAVSPGDSASQDSASRRRWPGSSGSRSPFSPVAKADDSSSAIARLSREGRLALGLLGFLGFAQVILAVDLDLLVVAVAGDEIAAEFREQEDPHRKVQLHRGR